MPSRRTLQREARIAKALTGFVMLSPTGLRAYATEADLADYLGDRISDLLTKPITSSQKTLEILGLKAVPLNTVAQGLDMFHGALCGISKRRHPGLISLMVDLAFDRHELGWTVSTVAKPGDRTRSCVMTLEQLKTAGYIPI